MLDISNLLDFRDEKQRQIDIDYHSAVAARNTEEIVNINSQLLKLQVAKAAVSVKGLESLHFEQVRANDTLQVISHSLESISAGFEGVENSINNLTDMLSSMRSVISEGFEQIAELLINQQQELSNIANTLRSPYETQLLELRKEADRWLRNGMRETGRDRDESFKDAMRLLQVCLDNPIGMQDYVTWFQMGWLSWKYKKDIPEAEDFFYRAQRLSKPKGNVYYLKSVRHLAHMQYLQDKFEDACRTINKVLEVGCYDHDLLLEAARYSARTGRKQEAIEYLDKCVELQPITSIIIFGEEDFRCS
jgi:tetratricopeptide (TPR) repeat protein